MDKRTVPPYVPREASAQEALAFVMAWLDSGPDEEMLRLAPLTQLEPLIDWHWETIADQLIELMHDRADLRQVVRGCMLDRAVPEAVQEALWRAASEYPDGLPS
jgi:hypothetical protein